jgi:hypothetical protein
MKNSLLMILTVFGIMGLNAQTVQRNVLIESFTQASCGPCAVGNPNLTSLINANPGKVVVLKYQTSWPGYDPMNEQNPEQVATRVDYYGVTGVPNVRIDGTLDAGVSGSVTQAQITNAYNVPAPLAMVLTHSLSADLSQITINCDITNPNTTAAWTGNNAFLRVAVIEKSIEFAAAPGSNGEEKFGYVMRQMYPDAQGTALTSIDAGATVNFTWTVDVPDYIYDYSQIAVVAFAQAQTSKTVYQAAISEPQPLVGDFPDAGFVTTTEGPTSLCEYSLVPSATVSNEGDIDLTSFDVSYTLNGGTPVTQSWTGTLAPGSSEVISFPTATIAGGTTVINYSLTNLNGGLQDIYSHNNLVSPEAFSVLPADPIGDELFNSIETSVIEGTPPYTIVDKADIIDLMVIDRAWFNTNLSTVPATNPAGGFAASEKSIMVGFWWTPPGTSTTMTFNKIDMSENINDTLSFDVAYRQYTSENDQLLVDISTDCGVTWENVYDKAGAELATVGASQTLFYPTAAHWRNEVVDLSAYDGAEEVIVRFTANAEFGNNLFLDNINIFSKFVSGLEDAIVESNVSVFPNPASSVVNIDFSMVKANEVSVQVYDVTGKLVTTLLENQVLGAGEQRVIWNNPAATGLYFVKILTEEGEISRKVSVVK